MSSELDLVEDIKKQASEQGGGCVCASVGWDTKLSRYNKTAVCSIHTTDPTPRTPPLVAPGPAVG